MPDVGERPAHLGQVLEQPERTGVVPGRRILVAGRDEDVVDPEPLQPVDDLGELGLAADHPGGQVRHDAVAVADQLLGQLEGRVESLRRARRHGQRDVARAPISRMAASIFAVGRTSYRAELRAVSDRRSAADLVLRIDQLIS